MRVFDSSINIYRKTLKRVRPVHVAAHAVMARVVIPALEKFGDFRTIPDDPFWFRMDLLTGKHEPETSKQIDQLVKPGMTVLDIGAHVGYYARRCSRLVGADGRIIAFEPHPRTFAVLSQNVGKYANVTPVQIAAAESEGTAELYDYLMMSASGSLHYDETMRDLQKAQLRASDIAPRIITDFPFETFVVRTALIDDVLDEMGIDRVDVVKMDIEGAEMGALRGMRRTITRSPGLSLVMEYNPAALKAFDFEPQAALDEVLGMGFTRMQAIEADGHLTDLTGDHTPLNHITAQLLEHMGVLNLLFTR